MKRFAFLLISAYVYTPCVYVYKRVRVCEYVIKASVENDELKGKKKKILYMDWFTRPASNAKLSEREREIIN